MHDHLAYMSLALRLAEQALIADEIPVGAIVVSPSGIITHGANASRRLKDPSAHAEVLAIRAMAKQLGNYRLTGCRLYVTLEPCEMCLGLLEHARIREVYFGTQDLRARPKWKVPKMLMHGPILQGPCQQILHDFFQWRRLKA